MLSRHDLYPTNGGAQCPELGGRSELDLILWVLFMCDGRRSVEDVARELKVDKSVLFPLVDQLEEKGVLSSV
jgi:aminopeptidase-like protein